MSQNNAYTSSIIENASNIWGLSHDETVRLLCLPRHRCVRINTLKMRKSTTSEINKNGILIEPIKWADNCYWVTEGYNKLSADTHVINGEVFLQNAASFVPVLALDPKSGENILDICAAPGGKTTHIASITGNKAKITANDTSRTRFFKMRKIFDTYGVSAETTLLDGRILRKHFSDTLFDKILLDAPCSGEAAIDPSQPKTFSTWSPAKIKRLQRLQEQLITVAYDLLKPGGVLLYSTCTINVEENEKVVNYLMKKRDAEILPLNIDIPSSMPGLISWNDKPLNKNIKKTLRLIPSLQNEAFYTAKIQKPINNQDNEDYYNPSST